ncbi:hypothetical protein DRI96_06030 [Candidatus Aerophobetes bacterium]|uniref:4Fe-4S ferredoxin-type domain-containing protein n=2 Tax=Aerophobetes bacterium TaxID=2030807 RepID=A0A662DAL7_UNCAE|nr:MAG: hypothetical protein DRI96_06030 [Candidatus Aerophobetes bacterium]
MKELFLSKDNYQRFLEKILSKFSLYAPLQKGDFLFYQKVSKENISDIVIDTKRAIHPLKSFFIPARRKVSEYFNSSLTLDQKERVILGAKACDLNALRISDSVYTGEKFGAEYKDPFYINARERTILISSDCMAPDENCFCNLLGSKPFPEEGFDLNLSSLEEGFVVQVGSEKGERLIKECESLFSSVDQDMIKKREKRREKAFKLLEKTNREFKTAVSYRELVKNSYDSPVWKEHSESCVDCGGCNQICPTCRCFLLSDKKVGEKYERYYLWDACLLTGFSRVAGGANPRKMLSQRFANRLFCKFYFFPENISIDACTGCGRCIAVCIGKIDMRKVFRDLAVERKIPVGLENE